MQVTPGGHTKQREGVVGSVSPLNSGCHITVVLLMAALHNTTAVSDQAKAARAAAQIIQTAVSSL